MLTKNNVIQLYNDGLVIRWHRKKHPQQLKGEYDPAGFEVNIYTHHLISEHDRDMTLLHELIHARDDRKGLPNNRTCSPRVEQEAEATFQRRPGVLALIKELFPETRRLAQHDR